MGTSRSSSTPKGGAWSGVKRQATSYLRGGGGGAAPLVGATVAAAGGLERGALGGLAAAQGRARGGGGGSGGAASLGTTAGGLGGFGASVSGGGLDAAVESLGLADLRGRSAIEVIALVAERLSQDADGVLGELLTNALRESLLEAASLVDDASYDDLEASLTEYLQQNGVDGLLEIFLTRYVTDSVWSLLESHAELTGSGENALDGMALAVENACRDHVHEAMDRERSAGSFDSVDWFGGGGREIANDIVTTIEQRLRAVAGGEGE